MAEVWPFAAKEVGTAVEYRYDLTALKRAPLPKDAVETHGSETVAAFVKGLPTTVKLQVLAPNELVLSAMGGLEKAPLAADFGSVSKGRLADDDPLGKEAGAKLRPALHVDEAKRLPSVDEAIVQGLRRFDAVLEAAVLDHDARRLKVVRELRSALLKVLGAVAGDVAEGARGLIARLIVAEGCGQRITGAYPPAVWALAQAQLKAAREDVEAQVAPHLLGGAPALACAHFRNVYLGRVPEKTRSAAAGLLLAYALLKDRPALLEQYSAVAVARSEVWGGATGEGFLDWASASSVENDIDASVQKGVAAPALPAFWSRPMSPVERYFEEFKGGPTHSSFDEFVVAASSGRFLTKPGTAASLLELREAAVSSLAVFEGDSHLNFGTSWRERLAQSAAALQGGHHDASEGNDEAPLAAPDRQGLRVRLMVPPHLEREPSVQAYARLEQALKGAATWARKRGRSMPAANARLDVRGASAWPAFESDSRRHSAVIGVGRRALAVSFASVPPVDLSPDMKSFFDVKPASQRYIIPALVTVSAEAKPGQKPLAAGAVRALVDRAGRRLGAVEAAFTDALKGARSP